MLSDERRKKIMRIMNFIEVSRDSYPMLGMLGGPKAGLTGICRELLAEIDAQVADSPCGMLAGILERHRCEDCMVLLEVDVEAGTATRQCWVCGRKVVSDRAGL